MDSSRTNARRPAEWTAAKYVLMAILIPLSACSGDSTTPEAPNPVPVIEVLSPGEFEDGGPGGTLVVQGTGFVLASEVRIDQVPRATTYTNPTRVHVMLEEADVAQPRTATVDVSNPPPGGGTSNTLDLPIRPAVFLTALEPAEVLAGDVGASIRVAGRGFTTSSRVLLSGEPVETVFLGSDTLLAELDETDLREAGSFSVSVQGPPPRERVSNNLTLTLLSPVPDLLLLPSTGAHTGGDGFTLVVHGSWFTESSIVRWNGQDRPTQYLGRTRLAIPVPAADLAAPGSVEVVVHNPPPAGGTSNPLMFGIRDLPFGPGSTLRIPLLARDLVYDGRSGSIYISVQASNPVHGNCVARVDPFTGEIIEAVFVGSDPTQLALSGDGEYLYVGLDGANAVRRVHVPTFSPEIQWGLPPGEVAGDIEVVPGQNKSVVVSRHRPGYSPPLQGVTLYDDGTERPVSSPGHTGGQYVAFVHSPDVLYGLDTGFPSYLFRISVSPDGLRHSGFVKDLFHGGAIEMVGAASRLYGTDGSVVDPELFQKVGMFPADPWSHGVAVDPETGRAFFAEDGEIQILDLNTFQRLRTLAGLHFDWVMPHPSEAIRHLIRWGEDGLAILDVDELYLIRNPVFGK